MNPHRPSSRRRWRSARHVAWPAGAVVALLACQPAGPKPPETPAPSASVAPTNEPAPLPPEETPSEEATPQLEPPNAKPVEPGITATGAPTRGTLPKAVIDERLKAVGPEIQGCYERGLKARPGLHGTLSINFVVATDGKVVHADAGAAEGDEALGDEATIDCVLAVIRKLEFPEPKGGRVFINYPLKLEPANP